MDQRRSDRDRSCHRGGWRRDVDQLASYNSDTVALTDQAERVSTGTNSAVRGSPLCGSSLEFSMHVPIMVLASITLVTNVANTVPRYDLKPTCRAAINLASGVEGRTIDSCLAGEEVARKQLEKDWSTTPVAEQNVCEATMAKGGYPSYVELSVCLEMMRDSRAHKAEERANNSKTTKLQH